MEPITLQSIRCVSEWISTSRTLCQDHTQYYSHTIGQPTRCRWQHLWEQQCHLIHLTNHTQWWHGRYFLCSIQIYASCTIMYCKLQLSLYRHIANYALYKHHSHSLTHSLNDVCMYLFQEPESRASAALQQPNPPPSQQEHPRSASHGARNTAEPEVGGVLSSLWRSCSLLFSPGMTWHDMTWRGVVLLLLSVCPVLSCAPPLLSCDPFKNFFPFFPP